MLITNKLNLIYNYKNIWLHNTPYYRIYLYTYSSLFFSPITYTSSQSKIKNTKKGKSKYLSTLISRYIYYIFNFINRCSHLFSFFRLIKKLKKYYYRKIYRFKKLIFFKKIKHIVLFFKEKMRRKVKKKISKLWKVFYNVPYFFWTQQKKKRIRSFIWRIINPNNRKKGMRFKYKYKKKHKFFFMNYNKMSNYIFCLFNRRFYKKKQWFALKKKRRNKKLISKRTTTNVWINYFLFFLINKKKKELFISEQGTLVNTYSSLHRYTINTSYFFLLHFNILLFNNYFINYFTTYCYFLYCRYIININRYNIKYLYNFYIFLSYILKKKSNISFIKANIINYKKNIIFSYHSFYIRFNNWFDQFYMDRDLYCHFLFNKLINNKFINIIIYNNYIIKKKYFFFYLKINKKISKYSIFYNNFQLFLYNKDINLDSINRKNINVNSNNGLKIRTRTFFPLKVYNYLYKIQIDLKKHKSFMYNTKNKAYFLRNKLFLNSYKNEWINVLTHSNHSINKLHTLKYSNNYVRKNRIYIKLCKRKRRKRNLFFKKLNNILNSTLFLPYLFNNIKFDNILSANNIINRIRNNIIRINKYKENKLSFKNKKFTYIKYKKQINIKKLKYFIKNNLNIKKKLIIKKMNICITYLNKLLFNHLFAKYNILFNKLKVELSIYTLLFLLKKIRKQIIKKKKIKKNNYSLLQFYVLRNNYINNKYGTNTLILSNKMNVRSNNSLYFYINQYKNIFINKQKNIFNLIHKHKKNNNKHNIYKKEDIDFFISIEEYNKLLSIDKYKYINILWQLKKEINNINLKKKNYNYLFTRYKEKNKLYYKYYFYNSFIYKEILIEYNIRLHYNNNYNEFERNFSNIGPLSFYHVKELDINNIYNGLFITSNIIFCIYNNRTKNLILYSLTNNLINSIIFFLFLPIKNNFFSQYKNNNINLIS